MVPIVVGDLVQDIRDIENGFLCCGLVIDMRRKYCAPHGTNEYFIVWSYGSSGWWLDHHLTNTIQGEKKQLEYMIVDVTREPELWSSEDPVRPELDVQFKTAKGRGVFGLLASDGEYKAFMCYAHTSEVPKNVEELDKLTTPDGEVVVPYTVWSREKGAGRRIIDKVLELVITTSKARRVVTLSPLTEMARKFHLRNNAIEVQVNKTTVNFEYIIT